MGRLLLVALSCLTLKCKILQHERPEPARSMTLGCRSAFEPRAALTQGPCSDYATLKEFGHC